MYSRFVTRGEAEERARRLQGEDPDRFTHRFVARELQDGAWSVAKLLLPEQLRRSPLRAAVEAKPRPPTGDDGRSGHERRAPGLPGGLGG